MGQDGSEMKIKLKYISNKGDPHKERLVFTVLANTDIGSFAVFEALAVEDGVSNVVHDTFWFPDKQVRAGDLVVLYTKSGESNEKMLDSGRRTHFFYWGSPRAKWSSTEKLPVVIAIAKWAIATAEDDNG